MGGVELGPTLLGVLRVRDMVEPPSHAAGLSRSHAAKGPRDVPPVASSVLPVIEGTLLVVPAGEGPVGVVVADLSPDLLSPDLLGPGVVVGSGGVELRYIERAGVG